MAITLIQSIAPTLISNGHTKTFIFSSSNTGGNSIIVACAIRSNDSSNQPSISDFRNNKYTKLVDCTPDGCRGVVYFASDIQSGPNRIWIYDPTNAVADVHVYEYSPMTVDSAEQGYTNGTSTTLINNFSAMTPATSGEMLAMFAFNCNASGTTFTFNTSPALTFTTRDTYNASTQSTAWADCIGGPVAGTAYTPSITLSAASTYVAAAAILFKDETLASQGSSRITDIAIEATMVSSSNARISDLAVEAMNQVIATARIGDIAIESVAEITTSYNHLSQMILELVMPYSGTISINPIQEFIIT